ncbi:MAG: hypothetical protein ACI9JN_001091 [Bacteroidia bacterium]|jgi:hypothetical protein
MMPKDLTDLKIHLREELLEGNHKSFWEETANQYANDEVVTQIFFDFMIEGKDRLARTTSEVIRHMSDINPKIALPFINDLIKKLDTDCHDGVKRCIFRMFQRTTFTEDQAGKVIEVAFAHLQDRSNPIAVRVFAMTTIYNLCKTYPELFTELEAYITENLSEESTGFQNRANKILNRTWK